MHAYRLSCTVYDITAWTNLVVNIGTLYPEGLVDERKIVTRGGIDDYVHK
jgi:hypothetical protein